MKGEIEGSSPLAATIRAEVSAGRVAQAFDLAGITNTVGAPFLRVFCEEPALSGAEGAGVGNAGAKWV
jgi:hypothetical protein